MSGPVLECDVILKSGEGGLSSLEHPTRGEEVLHRIFSKFYDDYEDVYVWYEHPVFDEQ